MVNAKQIPPVRNWLGLFIAIALLLRFLPATPASAQTYAFSLDRELVHVYWQNDGSLSLFYEFTFTNSTYGDPLDFVDVGLPTNDFSLSNVRATIDGVNISHIAHSPYVTNGVELGLGTNAIRPGQTGIVRAQIDGIRNVLYFDSTDSNYASAVFSPTWFGSEFVSGTTDLTVIFHLPPGITADQPRYHRAPSGWPTEPDTAFDDQGRVTYTWRNPNANGYTQYLFGASFPASTVPAHTISRPSIWQQLGIDPEALLGMAFFCGIGFMVFGIPILAVIGERKRKLKYLPPKIAIQGHGIKRGLTAIEAAILLEQPMDKILTMILFAVIKKGAASVISDKPLRLDVKDAPPNGLHAYETDFLIAMIENNAARRRKLLQEVMVQLVRSVTKKMKGFSQRETIAYYKDITERAWAQVTAANTPEIRSETYDKVMEWTMLDKQYDQRTREVFQHQPVYAPTWWGSYRPATSTPAKPSAKIGAPTSGPTPGGAGLPHLPGSDFAASVVSGVQNFSAGVIGNLTEFTGGVTSTTNPPPKTSTSSYRSSGGGSSCACACACAGCACACAGGGR